MLANLSSLNFNVFEYEGREDSLRHLLFIMFKELDLVRELEINDKLLKQFILDVNNDYLEIPFHNFMHAFDVTQMVFCFLTLGQMSKIFEPLDILAILIAAIAHDMGHPGYNNAFLAKTNAVPFKMYGANSTLELMAVDRVKKVLSRKESAFISHLTDSEQKRVTTLVTEIILATDMDLHMEILSEFTLKKNKLKDKGTGLPLNSRLLILKMMIKCADLSNVLRPKKTSKKWTDRVCREFFNQGDEEKKLKMTVSANMDRTLLGSTSLLQVTFMNAVVKPLIEDFAKVLPVNMDFLSNLNENYLFWKEEASKLE
jgi:high affinity cGMP-specific 3',5'-cyclic phosphodiesterase 9